MATSTYRKGETVKADDGRVATLVSRNRPYRQWLVRLSNGDFSWWWESMFSRCDKAPNPAPLPFPHRTVPHE